MKFKPITSNTTTNKILKALSIFGGVQFISIICSIIRTKLVAVWVGPLGVGLLALYNSTMEMLSTTGQLNLRQSAVRELSVSSDEATVSHIARIVRKLALILGSVGAVAIAIFSPLLSYWTFGDSEHIIPFIILSSVMLLSALASGEWAIMQGQEQLKRLATSTLYASLTATALSLPIFYYFRVNGIVAVVVIFAASNAFFAIKNRVKYKPEIAAAFQPLSLRAVLREGKPILTLGAYMTISIFATLAASYIFVVFLNHYASTQTVGIYQAGFTLMNSYVGVIFSAIAVEYYPRLSSIAKNSWRTSIIVSHEIKVSLLVLAPLMVLFICASDLIVKILYTADFIDMLPYITCAASGVLFRAVSWCMAYVILARGDGKTYIITEITSAVTGLLLNIAGYVFYGFLGLGIAYLLWYISYTIIVYIVYRRRYGMTLSPKIPLLTAIAFLATIATFLLKYLM